jgi:hypothetical protein
MSIEDLEEIRQKHESWLAELEGLAVEAICASLFTRFAIASNNWDTLYTHGVDFQNENDLHSENVIAIGEARPHLRKYFPRFKRFKDKAEATTKDLSGPGADLLSQTTTI